MKLLLLSIGRQKIYLNIEKRYKSSQPVVSLGCDCHPANMLKTLNLRTKSLPFDWLATDPARGLGYVIDNIKNHFEKYLYHLSRNANGEVISECYPYARFLHFKDLIENKDLQRKLQERADRFMRMFSNGQTCTFLFNTTSESLKTIDDADRFIASVNEFSSISNHDLIIYLRYDENYDENKEICEYLIKTCPIKINRYIRYLKANGLWGDKSEYPSLFLSMGIPIRLGFPRIFLSRSVS